MDEPTSTDNTPTLRTFPRVRDRVASGPVRFGDDWPGIYLRGDEAFALAITLDRLVRVLDESTERAYGLAETARFLRSCDSRRLGVDVSPERQFDPSPSE